MTTDNVSVDSLLDSSDDAIVSSKEVPMSDKQKVKNIKSFATLLATKSPTVDTFIGADNDETLDNVREYLIANAAASETKLALRGFILDNADEILVVHHKAKGKDERLSLDALCNTIAFGLIQQTNEASFLTELKEHIAGVVKSVSETKEEPSWRARYYYVAKGKGSGVCLAEYKSKKLE